MSLAEPCKFYVSKKKAQQSHTYDVYVKVFLVMMA